MFYLLLIFLYDHNHSTLSLPDRERLFAINVLFITDRVVRVSASMFQFHLELSAVHKIRIVLFSLETRYLYNYDASPCQVIGML